MMAEIEQSWAGREYAATIKWTLPMLSKFKRAYKLAHTSNKQVFDFEGHQFVLGYAKYLIEYLEQSFALKTP